MQHVGRLSSEHRQNWWKNFNPFWIISKVVGFYEDTLQNSDMSTDRYDIVVFGASGFTGQFVAEEVARVADEEGGLTWAIAGRSIEKLQTVLENASKKTGKDLACSIPIIIADTSREKSLLNMARKAKIVLNCVGPYRFHGEQVVKACLEGGASHIDISSEPQFLETMQLLYNGKAKDAGVYIIGSCGFESIPAEMGVIHVQQQFKGDVNLIESYLDVQTGTGGFVENATSFESAIYASAYSEELRTIRKFLFPEPLPPHRYKAPERGVVFRSKDMDKYCVEFMGSDKSVVYRTQRYNYDVNKKRPVRFNSYICPRSILTWIGMFIFSMIFAIMTKFSFGIDLLLKYPALFTFGMFKKGGPTKKQIGETSFTMTFLSRGWSTKLDSLTAEHDTPPDTLTMTKVTGPDPGYVTTPICMVQAAIIVLKEKDKLPTGGGVFTPGVAFADTTLIKRLQAHNVLFDEMKSIS